MENNESNPGVTVLQNNQAVSGIPAWLRTFNSFTVILVGVILALGINSGKILESYVNSRVANQTASQQAEQSLQRDALQALITISDGQSRHIVDLTLSINTLITENKRLTLSIEETSKTVNSLQLQIKEIEALNKEYLDEISQLKKQIESSGK